jgi:hypothetical protein
MLLTHLSDWEGMTIIGSNEIHELLQILTLTGVEQNPVRS